MSRITGSVGRRDVRNIEHRGLRRENDVIERVGTQEVENKRSRRMNDVSDRESSERAKSRKSKRKYFNSIVAKKVVDYVNVDNQIKKAQAECRESVKEKKKERAEFEKFIVDYLGDVGEVAVRVEGDALLTRREISRRPPITMKMIEECMHECFGELMGKDSKRLVGDMLATMDDMRKGGRRVRHALKRTKDR